MQIGILSAGVDIQKIATPLMAFFEPSLDETASKFALKLLKVIDAGIEEKSGLNVFLTTTLPCRIHENEIKIAMNSGNFNAMSSYMGKENPERIRMVRMFSLGPINEFRATLTSEIVKNIIN